MEKNKFHCKENQKCNRQCLECSMIEINDNGKKLLAHYFFVILMILAAFIPLGVAAYFWTGELYFIVFTLVSSMAVVFVGHFLYLINKKPK